MSSERLHQLLNKLHHEIDSLDDAETREKEKLAQLIAEIESTVEDEENAEAHETLLDAMRGKFVEFEAEHPSAAGVTRRLMQALSDMGI